MTEFERQFADGCAMRHAQDEAAGKARNLFGGVIVAVAPTGAGDRRCGGVDSRGAEASGETTHNAVNWSAIDLCDGLRLPAPDVEQRGDVGGILAQRHGDEDVARQAENPVAGCCPWHGKSADRHAPASGFGAKGDKSNASAVAGPVGGVTANSPDH